MISTQSNTVPKTSFSPGYTTPSNQIEELFGCHTKIHCNSNLSILLCLVRQFCLPNPCKNDGVCVPSTVAYTCSCKRGFKGDDCSGKKKKIVKDDNMYCSFPLCSDIIVPLFPRYRG